MGYYDRYQIKLRADEIIITSGGSEAVLFAFLSCLNPGDEIIVPEPAYANYMSFAISAGAVIRTVATTIEEGFCLPKVEKFEELINERTKAILICNPNNPTGYLYTQKEMNRIRDLVKKYNLYLFSDEVYREFIYTGRPCTWRGSNRTSSSSTPCPSGIPSAASASARSSRRMPRCGRRS